MILALALRPYQDNKTCLSFSIQQIGCCMNHKSEHINNGFCIFQCLAYHKVKCQYILLEQSGFKSVVSTGVPS